MDPDRGGSGTDSSDMDPDHAGSRSAVKEPEPK